MTNQLIDLPEDPTRNMRRLAIRDSVARVKAILKSIGRADLTPDEIATEANLRLERAKTVGCVEHAGLASKCSETE